MFNTIISERFMTYKKCVKKRKKSQKNIFGKFGEKLRRIAFDNKEQTRLKLELPASPT